MILVLGGTADTDPVTRALLERGQSVLVSTLTDYPLTLTPHPDLKRRFGALDECALRELVRKHRIVAVVDATHPYTEVIGPLSRKAATDVGIPYFRFLRPESRVEKSDAFHADGHPSAARIACSFEKPILLTIGSKNVGVYTQAASPKMIPLYARVLNRADSIHACLAQGVLPEAVIAARGPFTALDNISLIHRFQIGVLVTKESGEAGGMEAKIEAAEKTDCRLVIVDRPGGGENVAYSDVKSMISAIFKIVQ